jgi:hypothetical protein
MRQEVQLLSESLKNGFFFFFFFLFFFIMPRYPSNKFLSFTQDIEKYTTRFIYHTSQIIC